MSTGERAAHFDLSGPTVRVRGLPAHHARTLEEDWTAFGVPPVERPALDFAVHAEPESPDTGPFTAKSMRASWKEGAAFYQMKEGSAEVPAEGLVRVRLESTASAKQYFAFVNLVCAAVAFRLPSRGGAVLHAAGIVLEGRAFAMVGSEGSGKTTWALLAKAAGAMVLSDDLVVVEAARDGRLEALGTPFRSRQHGRCAPGRWPVAAILFPIHGKRAALAEVPALLTRARLLANLPFFAEFAPVDDRVARTVEQLAGAVPSRSLTFPLDASFLGLLGDFDPSHRSV